VLRPPELDVDTLRERTSSGERPLDIRIVGYADAAGVRQEANYDTACRASRSSATRAWLMKAAAVAPEAAAMMAP
jgi:hypothetical protein